MKYETSWLKRGNGNQLRAKYAIQYKKQNKKIDETTTKKV